MSGPMQKVETTLVERIQSILGRSEYEPIRPLINLSVDDKSFISSRRALGGQIQPIPNTQLRWYLADLEMAQAEADTGNFRYLGQLYRAMRRDGDLMGLMAQRTGGLVRLPKQFYGGNTKAINWLRSKTNQDTRNVFDEICPPAELEALDADGACCGMGIAELVPVRGRKYPVLVRMDPEWLTYNWADSHWYYDSRAGRVQITPGDGRWVLHLPGGRIAPWQWGNWAASGRAFIMKEHAVSLRGAFIAGVANPAKVMQAPAGATEAQRGTMFGHLLNWGPNMAVELPPGWELKLLEFAGKCHEVFQKEIDTNNTTYMVIWAGQVISTMGGSGFASEKLPATIRGDLIKKDGDALAYTLNTQVLPWAIASEFGDAAVDTPTTMEWITATAQDRLAEAQMLSAGAAALKAWQERFPEGFVSAVEFAQRFGCPLLEQKSDDERDIPPAEPMDNGDGTFDADLRGIDGGKAKKKPKDAAA